MPRRRPTRQGEPSHVVLDNEALAQIASGRPSRSLLVALEAAAATTGRVLMPTCVLLERGHDPSATGAAPGNRLLRTVQDDELTRSRAVEAVRLRNRAGSAASVVDAHVAAAALAAVRRYGGTATVATSDVGDLVRLLDATDAPALRTSTTVQAL